MGEVSPTAERVLRPSNARKAALAAAGLAVSVLGYGAATLGLRIGWVIFSGGVFMMVVMAGILATGRHCLVINECGIRVVALTRTVTYEWSEFAAFAVAAEPLSGIKNVVFELTPEALAARAVARFERRVSGHDGGLPDTYGMTAEDLCELLAAEQRRHLGGHHIRERVH